MKNATQNLSVKIKKHHTSETTPSQDNINSGLGRGVTDTAIVRATPNRTPPASTRARAKGSHCMQIDKENIEPLPPSLPRSISGALPDIISEDEPLKETHAKVGDSFAPHLEPDTSGPHILLHREAREGHLEFLLWAPI
ncbi:conserved hypothetical protein [Histoplasma capsulatum H143]|nr:conserved hypothetical protein [Histoplasma capsulatum H143]